MEENKGKKIIFWDITTKIILGTLTLLLILSFTIESKFSFSIIIFLVSFTCILVCLIKMVLYFLILGKNLPKEEVKKFYKKQMILILIYSLFFILSAVCFPTSEREYIEKNEVSHNKVEKSIKESKKIPKEKEKKYEFVEYSWKDSLGGGTFFIKYKKEVNSINLEELVQTDFCDHIKITNYETKDIIAIAPMYGNATISPTAIANIAHSKYEQRNGGYYFFDGKNIAKINDSYSSISSFFVKQGECFVYYHKKDGKLEDSFYLIIDSIKCNNPIVK